MTSLLWFHLSAALLLLAALGVAATGLSRRRVIEGATLLVILLPVMRLGFESFLPTQAAAIWPGSVVEDSSELSSAWPTCLAGIWLAGMGIQGLLLARRWAAVQSLKATDMLPSVESVAMISACLQQPETIIRRYFRVSEFVKTPLVLPGLHSVILLPAHWDAWPLRLRAGALRHEWHHLRHHDALWNVWMTVFRMMFWFHPLAWISVKVWTDSCENEADLAAVGSTDPADYAQDLLGLVKLQSFSAGAFTGTGFLGSSRAGLHHRIQTLLSDPSPQADKPLALKMAGPILILVLTLACAWMGMRKQAAEVEEATLRLSANAFPGDE